MAAHRSLSPARLLWMGSSSWKRPRMRKERERDGSLSIKEWGWGSWGGKAAQGHAWLEIWLMLWQRVNEDRSWQLRGNAYVFAHNQPRARIGAYAHIQAFARTWVETGCNWTTWNLESRILRGPFHQWELGLLCSIFYQQRDRGRFGKQQHTLKTSAVAASSPQLLCHSGL